MVKSLDELYEDKQLYSSPNMFSPPSERLSHVIRFELTKGCNWGRCTYCGGYDGVRHSTKSLDTYKRHVDEVWNRIGNRSELARSLGRIFIGGGNALLVDTDTLQEAIQYSTDKFKEYVGAYPRRIALYGRTQDIIRQGKKGLRKLRYHNKWKFFTNDPPPSALSLIYWGVESGSSDVLSYVRKGCTEKELKEAAKILRSVPIDVSVMIMPGLGGIRFYDEHVKCTARVLGKIRPRFLTFMGINPAQNSPYSKTMAREQNEGTNRPLTEKELAYQMTDIIEQMPIFETKIGCFDSNVDAVGYNPIHFGSYSIYNSNHKTYLVMELRKKIKTIQ